MHGKHLVKALGLSVLAIAGVIAVSASAAQAKLTTLLNGVTVNPLHVSLIILASHLKANGLEIACSGGEGEAFIEEEGTGLKGAALAVFTGCHWVGAEAHCTINDPVTGLGTIHAEGTGTITMSGTSLIVHALSAEFATIHTEGALCSFESEEVLSGTIKAVIENGETDGTVLLGHFLSGKLFFGEVQGELAGEFHIKDALEPAATIGFHLS